MTEMQPQGQFIPFADGQAGHERDEVGGKGIVLFAAGLVATGAVILFVLNLVMNRYAERQSKVHAAIPPLLATPVEVPGPKLQSDPAAERLKLQRQQLEQLNDYGWIDRDAGIAHIPIDRAMDILATKGLPEIKEQESPFEPPVEKSLAKPSDLTTPRSDAGPGGRP